MNYSEADKKVHPVTSQWHWPIAQQYGFKAVTKEATGLVRSYTYHHSGRDLTLVCTTGAHADYWKCGAFKGYWRDLAPTLEKLTQSSQGE